VLHLAFNVQGQTFQQVVISLKGIFRAGMAYVALSRATHLKNLFLLDYNKNVPS
jgi:ATP-dependent exoDNAse (exonuclease V) alpha subunit